MLNIGRKHADRRLAHFLCEMVTHMRALDLVQDSRCPWPFTQTEIGDAFGITTVHVNRVLQDDLRAAGLITLAKGTLTVNDWDGCKALGEFDPTYLHQVSKEAA